MRTIRLSQVFEFHFCKKGTFIIETVDYKTIQTVEVLPSNSVRFWYNSMVKHGQLDAADTFKSLMLHLHRN